MSHFRRYGAIYILLVFALLSTGLFYEHTLDQVEAEAIKNSQNFDKSDANRAFWVGMFENLQSEWWQLFLQFLLIGALGKIIFFKEKEDLEEIKAMIQEMKSGS